MNNIDRSIETGDIVELKILKPDVMATNLALYALYKTRFFNTKKISKAGYTIKERIGDFLYIDSNGMEFVLDLSSGEIENPKNSDVCYGFMVNVHGHPFVAYHDGITSNLVPYGSVVENVEAIYRHHLAENEVFLHHLMKGVVISNHVETVSKGAGLFDVACSFKGNQWMNFIYLVFSSVGLKFPDEWCESGAPEDLLKNYIYGFMKV